MELPGTYEYNLVKQMNLTSDDERGFTHPFLEETTKQDFLRRVVTSEVEWSDFIAGCYDDPDKAVEEPATITNNEEDGADEADEADDVAPI